jgi:hypothetical protein
LDCGASDSHLVLGWARGKYRTERRLWPGCCFSAISSRQPSLVHRDRSRLRRGFLVSQYWQYSLGVSQRVVKSVADKSNNQLKECGRLIATVAATTVSTMSTLVKSISLGRMATLPFALFECCFVFWFARTLPLFSRNRFTRLAGGAMFICVVAGLVIGQCLAYVWAANAKRLNDPFLMIVILIESFISTGILFRVLIERRKRNRRSEEREQ